MPIDSIDHSHNSVGNEIVSYGLCMHSHLENNEYFPGLIGFGLRKSHACISDGYLLPFHLLSAGIIYMLF